VSPALAEVLGKEQASRSELTKFFWDYFKSNQLQVRG
jgi:chromatin remodeling complex protein RSC6